MPNILKYGGLMDKSMHFVWSVEQWSKITVLLTLLKLLYSPVVIIAFTEVFDRTIPFSRNSYLKTECKSFLLLCLVKIFEETEI